MKTTLAVLLAAAALGAAAPAAACDCLWDRVNDDISPPHMPALPPAVQAQVVMRDGRGLSQAGFYNDPSAYFGFGAGYGGRPIHRPASPSSGGPYVLQSRY